MKDNRTNMEHDYAVVRALLKALGVPPEFVTQQMQLMNDRFDIHGTYELPEDRLQEIRTIASSIKQSIRGMLAQPVEQLKKEVPELAGVDNTGASDSLEG